MSVPYTLIRPSWVRKSPSVVSRPRKKSSSRHSIKSDGLGNSWRYDSMTRLLNVGRFDVQPGRHLRPTGEEIKVADPPRVALQRPQAVLQHRIHVPIPLGV